MQIVVTSDQHISGGVRADRDLQKAKAPWPPPGVACPWRNPGEGSDHDRTSKGGALRTLTVSLFQARSAAAPSLSRVAFCCTGS